MCVLDGITVGEDKDNSRQGIAQDVKDDYEQVEGKGGGHFGFLSPRFQNVLRFDPALLLLLLLLLACMPP